MAFKEFKLALDTAPTGGDDTVETEPITFKLSGDDYTYHARTKFKEDALGLVVARMQRSKGIGAIADLEATMRTMLEPVDADRLFDRITDVEDGLKFEHLIPVMDWVIREITEREAGRPTESQPA